MRYVVPFISQVQSSILQSLILKNLWKVRIPSCLWLDIVHDCPLVCFFLLQADDSSFVFVVLLVHLSVCLSVCLPEVLVSDQRIRILFMKHKSVMFEVGILIDSSSCNSGASSDWHLYAIDSIYLDLKYLCHSSLISLTI